MNKIVIIFVVVITVIALSLTGIILFGMNLLDDENEELAILEVGDFAEYNSTQRLMVNGTWITLWKYNERDTIVAINDNHYSMNITIFSSIYLESWPKNWTFGARMDVTDSGSDYNLVMVGEETVDTKWGPLNCDHYVGSGNSILSPSYDVFVKDGILIEWVTTFLVNDNTQMYIFMLNDTNISEIVND
jgi:hypothetical protein